MLYIIYSLIYIFVVVIFYYRKKNIHYNVLYILKQTFNSESKMIYFNVNFKFEDIFFLWNIFTLVICLFAYRGVQYILCCIFLRLVYSMFPDCLDWQFLIAPSVFSNVFFLIIIWVRIIGIYHNFRPFFNYIGTTEQL